MAQFALSTVLKTGMFALLNWLGWLTLMSNGHAAHSAKEIISVAFASALIFAIVGTLTVIGSCGLAILLWTLLGWIILELMHQFAPEFLALSHSFWLTALSGFLILSVRVPLRKSGDSKPMISISID